MVGHLPDSAFALAAVQADDGRGVRRVSMHTIGVLLLAAATAGDGFGYAKPGVGLKKLLRPHVTAYGAPPPGGPITPGAGAGGGAGAGAGACSFGHPGCAGGPSCPGGGGGGGGGGGAGGGFGGRRFPNVKSQIYFLDPDGMKIGWQASAGGNERVYLPGQLTVPARYNFMQGYIYRLKLTDIPGRPGVQLYPTIEVAPATPPTDAYLTHNPIPVQFTPEDFDQVVDGGNFVTKVIYLPDPKYQELAVAGVETLVSTRLEPGVDPILEADKRGTILLIVRLGAIDLEMPAAGSLVGPGEIMVPGSTVVAEPGAAPAGPPVLAPGWLPPGGVMTGPPPAGVMSGPPPTGVMSGPPPAGVMSGPPPAGMMGGPPPAVPLESPPNANAPGAPVTPAPAPSPVPPANTPPSPPPGLPAEPPPAPAANP
jgi:hypothetical protein